MNKFILDIEIPVANKQNVIYTCLLPSLKYLVPLKDEIRLLLNFNGACSNEDIEAVLKELENYKFNYNYIIKEYLFAAGEADNLIIRRDTHNIVQNHAPYFLFFDDDILITSYDYSKILLEIIDQMQKNLNIGMIQIDSLRPERKEKLYALNPTWLVYTGNGIVFRNIEKWQDIIPKKYTVLKGRHIDELLVFSRYEINLQAWTYWSNCAQHKELQENRGGTIIDGKKYWGWSDNIEEIGTVSYLFAPYKYINNNGIEQWNVKKAFPHLGKYWKD